MAHALRLPRLGCPAADGAAERTVPAVAIGPVTARAAREEGFPVAAVADPHTIEGVAAALSRALGPAPTRIFHIAAGASAESAEASGSYEDESLANEGFIHASFAEQVNGVANALFRGRDDLVLLEVDTGKLTSPLMVERGSGGGDARFPHVYGPVNWDAVVAVHALDPGPDGSFDWSPKP